MKQRAADYRGSDRKDLFTIGGAQYEAGESSVVRGKTSRPNRSGAQIAKAAAAAESEATDSTGAMKRAFRSADISWTNLPGARAEVEAVSRLFPAGQATQALGSQASEAYLMERNRAGELAKFRYLHFATHGYMSPESPAMNAIVRGQLNNPPDVDGFITAREWPQYNLKSDLMFLSACETGLGRFVDGTGVTGLPYALYVAGNTSLVLTLWPVVDESTAAFVVSFFTRVKGGMGKSAALSETKREFLRNGKYTHPAIWAGFAYYGD